MTNHDLDALLDEIGGVGETVTLFGDEWTLPTDVDAETMLRVQRLQMRVALAKRQGREVTEDEVVDDAVSLDKLVEVMAGSENYRAWVERGLGYRQMQAVAGRLFAIHSGDAGTPAGKGPKHGPVKRTPGRTGTGPRSVSSR